MKRLFPTLVLCALCNAAVAASGSTTVTGTVSQSCTFGAITDPTTTVLNTGSSTNITGGQVNVTCNSGYVLGVDPDTTNLVNGPYTIAFSLTQPTGATAGPHSTAVVSGTFGTDWTYTETTVTPAGDAIDFTYQASAAGLVSAGSYTNTITLNLANS